MRIVLLGGGTGGHFYPLVAVSEALEDLIKERTLIEPELYYMGPSPFDAQALLEHDVVYLPSAAGKMRRYASFANILGFFPTAWGILRATFQLWGLYPDVIFSTGGYAAFPTLYAARLLRIPVVIYDADATPGRVSLWSSKFAQFIGVAHTEAAGKFPEKVRDKIALVGHPIRKEIEMPSKEGGYEFLKLDPTVQTLFIMGGSQGARAINDAVLDALPDLVSKYNVIHQTGNENLEEVSGVANLVLKAAPNLERYRPFGLLNALALRMAAGVANLVVARAGSGTIFEVASWGLPAILVPIPEDISHDQTHNAFSYARSGAATVLEQKNLTPHLLSAEIDRIMNDREKMAQMSQAAKVFAKPDAAKKIANILLQTALQHTE
ncbi:MAG TPA: UDP-N-acetylglucosamine--N-acetylmuramyl-(pentapeptide) pyrophosphoryl-undecaprenol N-acetylglucosamine transferase [Candidatus Paceibacterota bacterium]|nr:UDP-N-acetylglucosamine--N-acetylmuramyl-(pentapeptide) pyrophosphoryl-undecaprenol N-acetylglucosamine transferase [Candidatus Paceibacterota bacterium]